MMTGKKISRQDTLHAFYDLGVSTNSFDILCFLVVAERARRRGGHGQLSVVIVPSSEDIKFPEQLYEMEHEAWRIQNILVASCWLLRSCKSVTVAESRDHAANIFENTADATFPQNYTVDKPVSSHHTAWPIIAAHEGDNLQFLHASSQARAYARQWLDEHSEGKKAVVLTLREAKFTPKRNSDIAAWEGFAQRLKEAGFFPVVLHDIETALNNSTDRFPGIALFPEAVFNLDLRMGLYEECHICAFVSNGPSTPCYFNENTRYLYFVSGEWLHDKSGPTTRVGLKHGSSPPFTNHFQRWIWKNQDADTFMEEFTALDAFIDETEKSGTYQDYLEPIEANREPTLLVAERISDWISYLDAPVDAELDILSYLLGKENSNLANKVIILRIRGIFELRARNIDAAIDCFKLSIKLGNDEKSLDLLLRIKSAFLDDLGVVKLCERAIENGFEASVVEAQLKQAKANLRYLADLNFGHFTKRAEFLLNTGQGDKAEALLEAAYGQHDRRGMYGQLAMVYKVMGEHEKSAATLKRAVDEGLAESKILYHLGVELIEAKYLEEAISVFEFLQENRFESARVTLALGQLYEATDKPDAALACYRRAQQSNIANPEINDRESRLANSILSD